MTELLNLCRSDLAEVIEQLKQKVIKDAEVETQLRAELIEQGRKMTELCKNHEQTIYELAQSLTAKFESELLQADTEFKQQVTKLMAEIS